MVASDLDFDLTDPAVITDPYPSYARLRDNAPVHHLAGPDLWVISRYDDVVAVLRDQATFSSDLTALARDLKFDRSIPPSGSRAA